MGIFQRNRFSSGWVALGHTITDALDGAVKGLLLAENPDAVLNIESHAFNVCIEAGSCEYGLDVGKQLWLNIQRWSRLVREYIPKDDCQRFVVQCREIYGGEARDGATTNLLFRDPKRQEKKHRWGGCLMGATFRGARGSTPIPTLTFYSRTCYMGYIGMLDAAIAHVMAQKLIAPEDSAPIQFRWHISSMQLHCFKTIPFLFSNPALMKRLESMALRIKHKGFTGHRHWNQPPTLVNMGNWYLKILEAYEQYGTDMLNYEKYGPLRRIKRRWLEYKGFSDKAPPPSLPVSKLTFTKAE